LVTISLCRWNPCAPRRPFRLSVFADEQEPVSTYRDALWRNFEYQREAGIDYQATPIPWAIQLVADMFWVASRKVRAGLIKMSQMS